MTITNQNLIQEEIKRRFNSGNAEKHKNYNIQYYNFACGWFCMGVKLGL
jgi:hypothetical protein